MALKTDSDSLTKELKAGAKVGRNFIFSPGGSPEESYLALSKKKIPPTATKVAKKESKKPLCLQGSCFKDGAKFVFETPEKVSPALTQKLRKCIKAKTKYPPAAAELRQNAGWVEKEFADEDETPSEEGSKSADPGGGVPGGPALLDLKTQYEESQARMLSILEALAPLVKTETVQAYVSQQQAMLQAGQQAMADLDAGELPKLLGAYKDLVEKANVQLQTAKAAKAEYDSVAGDLPKLKKGVTAVVKGKHPDAAEFGKLIKLVDASVKAKDWKAAATAIEQVRANLGPALSYVTKKAALDARLKKDMKTLQAGFDHDPGSFLLLKKLHKAYKADVAVFNAAYKKGEFDTALKKLDALLPQAEKLVQLDKEYAAYQKFKKANKASFDFLEKLNNSCPPKPLWKAEMNAYWGLLRKYWASDFKGALADLQKVVKKIPDLKKKVEKYDKEATKKADKASTELKDMVKGKSFTFPDTAQGKKDEAKLVKKLADEVGKLKPEKQLQLLEDLHGPTAKLTKEQRIMQRALYRKIKMDKSFATADAKLRDAYQNALKKDKELQDAVGGWNKTKSDGTPVVDNEKKKKVIERILKQQCASLKIPVPPINWYYENSGSCGSFSQNTGVMKLNEKLLSDMSEMIDTVLHENTHNFQDQLCKRYLNGEIKESDPLYKQAKAFAALHHMDAYVPPSEDYDCYKKQPEEDHAWDAGGKESKRLIANLKSERRKRLKAEAKKKKKAKK